MWLELKARKRTSIAGACKLNKYDGANPRLSWSSYFKRMLTYTEQPETGKGPGALITPSTSMMKRSENFVGMIKIY